MKKATALSLLFVFLSANTELHQFFKLPVLVHHYFEHHPEEQDNSFFHFLSDHYSNAPEHQDYGHPEHDELPFKTNDCAAMHPSNAFNLYPPVYLFEPKMVPEKMYVVYKIFMFSSTTLNNIWQPPKNS